MATDVGLTFGGVGGLAGLKDLLDVTFLAAPGEPGREPGLAANHRGQVEPAGEGGDRLADELRIGDVWPP